MFFYCLENMILGEIFLNNYPIKSSKTDCTIIFADWRTCLQVQITSDPAKKEVNEKLY